MKKLFLVVIAVLACGIATQAAVITSAGGDSIDPDVLLTGYARDWNVTLDYSTPMAVEDLFSWFTYVSINGTNYDALGAATFGVSTSSYSGNSGYTVYDNLAGTLGLNAGEMSVRFDWEITDMLGAIGGSRVVKGITVYNNSGGSFSDVAFTEVIDLDIVDSGMAINQNTGSRYAGDTLTIQGNPNDYGTNDFRGYLAWVRGTLDSYEISTNPLQGSLTDTPTGLYFNGQGVGPADLRMMLEHHYGSLADSADTGAMEIVVQIPEPSTCALLVVGLAGVLTYRRRKS